MLCSVILARCCRILFFTPVFLLVLYCNILLVPMRSCVCANSLGYLVS